MSWYGQIWTKIRTRRGFHKIWNMSPESLCEIGPRLRTVTARLKFRPHTLVSMRTIKTTTNYSGEYPVQKKWENNVLAVTHICGNRRFILRCIIAPTELTVHLSSCGRRIRRQRAQCPVSRHVLVREVVHHTMAESDRHKHDDTIKWTHFPRCWGLYEGNPPVTGGFTSQRPVTRSIDVFFDKLWSKQSRRQWFETPSRSLWHHCNDTKACGIVTMSSITLSSGSQDVFQSFGN